jgi:hypothetical protein
MDMEQYYRFMKWTTFVVFCIIFPPIVFLLLIAMVMFMVGGK